jgi:hypothetical protein
MTDVQVVVLATPSVLSVIFVLLGILINTSRLGDLRSHIDSRFDDMRDTWRG